MIEIGIYHEPDGTLVNCEINDLEFAEIYLESNDKDNIPSNDKWLRVIYKDNYVEEIDLMPDDVVIYKKEMTND